MKMIFSQGYLPRGAASVVQKGLFGLFILNILPNLRSREAAPWCIA
jgi:hypothetical protein